LGVICNEGHCMKNMSKIAIWLLTMLAVLSTAQVAQAGDWPMFGHDASHSGATGDDAEPPLQVLWKYNISGDVVVSNSVVYGSDDGYLYALDARDGSLIWKYKFGVYMSGSPAISENMVYFSADHGYMYAVETSTGHLKWEYKSNEVSKCATIGGIGIDKEDSFGTPTVSDGVVYAGACSGYVFAIDARDGSLRWKYMTEMGIVSSPAVSGGVVYVGSWDKYVYALNALDGTLKWKYDTDSNFLEGSPSVWDETVFVGSGNYVYALNAMEGSLKWKYKGKYETGGWFRGSPAVSEGVVYVGNQDGYMYALGAADGSLKWKYEIRLEVSSSPAVSGDTVYVSSWSNNIYALDAINGSLKWKYQIGTFGTSSFSPVVSGSIVYIGSNNGSLYAFAPSVSITVSSNPIGASVYLDGSYKGTTPITIPDVPFGSNKIKLNKPDYNDIEKKVIVTVGQNTYVTENLILQTGSIKISSDPNGAEVYFNGTYKGVTPITITNVPIGTYSVVLKKFGYTDWTQVVNIRADSVTEINPSMELQYQMFIGIAIIAIFLIGGAALRKHIPKENTTRATEKPKPVAAPSEEPDSKSQAVLIEKPKEPLVEKPKESDTISVKSAYEYRGAKIYYKIKIENNAIEPVGDIKVYLFVPEVFLLAEKEKAISMLETKESKTVTFEIRPTGECGECNVSGKIEYYDYATKGRKMLDIENKSLSVICPVLKRKEISMQQWEKVTDELIKAEEKIKELSAPAENLFNITSRVIKDNGMFMFKPEITSTPSLFNGLAMFYAEGVTGYRYAAYMEVVGGARKSRMILKVWAEKEEALIGFYHRILDDIEKRIDVKIFIDDAIVQQHIHIGDQIGTQVKDSFVQRSNIGAGEKKCPECGKEVEANEKICNECGARL
jgi:outer membrane protein assembly factor BamB